MVVSNTLQAQQLPNDLPFRVISRTIGQGAYAFIRKACPVDNDSPVIAVKFIHKRHAFEIGRVKPKQIQTEVSIHQHVGKHVNIIKFLASGEDPVWSWIAMELADGDLFDKVEADEGLGEDAAHLYFTQLISAMTFMHGNNVAHRDIKPENILLSDGNMKLADFGLAVLYGYKGKQKRSHTVCGSPPYMAPEIIAQRYERGEGYRPDVSDIWSCAIVLFVLLVGNTPWDEATLNSDEYRDYIDSGPRDELWLKVPQGSLSLLRGMLRPDPAARFTLEDVRRHPWFTRPNRFLATDGLAADPIGLATHMLGKMNINLDREYRTSQGLGWSEAMDVDMGERLASTQPETPVNDILFDWEAPARVLANEGFAASQPAAGARPNVSYGAMHDLMDDPILSQFASTPYVPLTLTQRARQYKDIVPAHSMTNFVSFCEFRVLLPVLRDALANLGVMIPQWSDTALAGKERKVFAKFKTLDQRNCSLAGVVSIEVYHDDYLEVRFHKNTGDPVEWRRLFKKVTGFCKDTILRPD